MTDPRTRDDALKAATRLLEARARVAESVAADYSAWWGLSPQDLGVGDTPGWEPPGGPAAGLTFMQRKKRGEFIPAFLNEQQLRLYRQQIRALVVGNPIARNVIGMHTAYAVGQGFRYQASAKKGREADPGVEALVERTQVVIDAFCEHNELALREREMVARVLTDGEQIWRLFPRESGILSVRTVEPEHLYSPTGDAGDDSFGIRTAPGDVETPLGYWIVTGVPDQGATPEYVDASEVVHVKHPDTPCTSKRGLPGFWPVTGELRAEEDLVKSVVDMSKARAKIAWVERIEGSTIDVAQALAASQAVASPTDPATGQSVNQESYRRGSILRTNSDIEFPSASVSATDYVEVLAMVLRNVASCFGMPEYLLTADASNANYSSTMVAESPWVKTAEGWQDFFGRILGRNRYGTARRSLVWRQIAYAVERGLLPPEVFRLVDVQVTGPTLTVRDVAKEAQVDQILHGMGAKSLTTIQLQQDLDPDEQAANFAKERKAGADADPAILPPVPGMKGAEQVAPDQQQERPPAPTRESRDASGHEHGPDGKFGPGGSAKGDKGDKATASKAAKVLDFAKAAPARIAAKVKDQVAKKYAALSSRYGPKYARAIIAAGIAGVPLPVPGSSFITAAPVIALAEMHRMISRGKAAVAESAEGEMSDEEVEEAARELVAELYEAFGVVQVAEGYSGTRTDKLGHSRCYSDGRQVPCNAGGVPSRGGPSGRPAAAPPHARPAEKPRQKPPPEAPSDKSKFVGARVDARIHRHAEEVKNEVAAAVGGIPEEETSDAGQRDKKPYDVKIPGRRGDHDIEVKSMSVGGKQAISVHEDALLRKVEHVAAHPRNTFHTVVIDSRETFDGGANAANYSGNRIYYKRGSGRYALSKMHPVKDEAELKRLILAPESELPEAARGQLPPPPPIEDLKATAAKASESRKARDKARKEKNKDKLRDQARARAARAKGVN